MVFTSCDCCQKRFTTEFVELAVL